MPQFDFTSKQLDWSEQAYLELEDELFHYVHQSRYDPLSRNDACKKYPGLKELLLMRDPAYIGFTAKFLLGVELLPIQMAVQEVLWNYSFPMMIASRGFAKSFGMAVQNLLRCVLFPGTRVVICGAGFRQSQVVFNYMMTIYNNAHILKSILGNTGKARQRVSQWEFELGESIAIAIPIGQGDGVRGLRANVLQADEFNSIPIHVFERAISGFTIVSQDPIDKVKRAAQREYLMEKGSWTEKDEEEYSGANRGNQVVLAGTVSSKHGHFYDYYKQYKAIILSRGDKSKLEGIVDDEKLESGINWKDYCILRVPYDMVPSQFLDPKMIARAKATMHSAVFNSEYGACFYDDTDGFFKESIIRRATAEEVDPVMINGQPIWFDALIRGDNNGKYVIGIDPAASRDNFAIVIIELKEDHSRIVYCWTVTEKIYRTLVDKGLTTEKDYYSFCCRKIRDLMRVFPTVRIGIDSQGGGNTIKNLLSNPDYIEEGEQPIWEIVEEGKEKPSDREKGLHILELIQFANLKWSTDANHDLRADIENLDLLFPQFNPVLLGMGAEQDYERKSSLGKDAEFISSDSLENCMTEIEELKKELINIIVVQRPTHEKFDVPQQKGLEGQPSYKLKKDRYSALLIANSIARKIARASTPPAYLPHGGLAGTIMRKADKNDELYTGAPAWWSVQAGMLKGISR